MAYQTILLHLHDAKRAARLLEVAASLARDMDAHLIGLCVLPPYVVIPAMEGSGTTVTVEAHRDAYQTEMIQLKAMFAETVRQQAIKAEWREADAGFATAADRIVDVARVCDLVVASQKDPVWSYTTYLEEPERLAIECGRPVLLVHGLGKHCLQLDHLSLVGVAVRLDRDCGPAALHGWDHHVGRENAQSDCPTSAPVRQFQPLEQRRISGSS